MSTHDKDQAFINQTKQLLDKSANELDTATRAELRSIRHHALATQDRKKWWLSPMPALAATAAVLVVTVSVWFNQPHVNNAPVMDDMALLSTNDELEFYQDIEFYEWLEHEQQI